MQLSMMKRFKQQQRACAKPLVLAFATFGLMTPLGLKAETPTDLGTVGAPGGGVSAIAPASAFPFSTAILITIPIVEKKD